ncbi:PspA/IM30 family protein [Streptomyces sp. NBC_00083]|uniref:PspA/IM30 family protein n=1 Tax=Streptomyces sp. NBC_00083 TaxID=2975647 RepID=UPI0022599AC2|nr:PspA/IM30 family protein [Streptomyces sp. NBC_00083]MCX5385416.1 PspA/IM30 family protein [Streptomyces sp. NBC_00083]
MSDKQSVLGRAVRLSSTDVGALVERAEDPRAVLDQLVRDYTDAIADAERAVSTTLGTLRLLEQDHAEDVKADGEWGARARAVSRKADALRASGAAAAADTFDRLAKVALARQLRSEREATAAEPAIAAQRDLVARLGAALDGMRTRLGALKSRHDGVRAMSRTTGAAESVNALDTTTELGRFEDKVRREEARLAGRDVGDSCLDSQFERLDDPGDTAEVEARLAALKATT